MFVFYVCFLLFLFSLVGVWVLAERENGGSLPRGFGEAVTGVSENKFLQVVLVSPQVWHRKYFTYVLA